jgi:hypothetical protein
VCLEKYKRGGGEEGCVYAVPELQLLLCLLLQLLLQLGQLVAQFVLQPAKECGAKFRCPERNSIFLFYISHLTTISFSVIITLYPLPQAARYTL